MTAFGWITTRFRIHLAPSLPRRQPRKPVRRDSAPRLETLESIELLSRASLLHHAPLPAPHPVAEVIPFTAKTVTINSNHALTASQTTTVQTVTVPDQLTNFSQAFAPPINLFDQNLGQLVAVHITATATVTSQIKSQNTSTTSGADITGFTNGTFSIDGLGVPVSGNLNGTTSTVTVQPFAGGPITFMPPSGVTFPVLTTTSTKTINITDAATLAMYKATPGHTTISPVLNASDELGAKAPNGNLHTDVTSTGSGQITINYEYMPMCPPITNLVRFGIHHQPTQLQLTFGGTLDPTDASNAANYVILAPNAHGSFVGPGVRVIPVASAGYATNPDGVTSTVTLTVANQLNVHHLFQLRVTLACNNGNPINIEFGGKKSLGGFYYHGQHYIVVNGKAIPG